MKSKIFLLLISLSGITIFSQNYHGENLFVLTNTAWEGIMNVPTKTQVELHFSKDIFELKSGSTVLETMSYSVKDKKIVIEKINGVSLCSKQIGTYEFSVANDKLFLKKINDNCRDRSTELSQMAGFSRARDLEPK